MPIPHNGQAHLNNWLANRHLSVFDHFVGLAVKGLRKHTVIKNLKISDMKYNS